MKNIKSSFIKNTFAPLTWIICLCIAITVWVTAYSAFKHAQVGTGKVEIASVAIGGQLTLPVDGISPASSTTCAFKITNIDGGEISDVAQNYEFTISDLGNLPLSYSIKESSTTKGQGTLASGLSSTSAAKGGVLQGGIENEHTYTIEIVWDASATSPEYADEIDMITISVSASQSTPEPAGGQA